MTGYQGGELNALGAYYIIRQSDAHAWTEVWLADEGWVRVDPVSAVAPERVALGSWRSSLGGDRVPGQRARPNRVGAPRAARMGRGEHLLERLDRRLRPRSAARAARIARVSTARGAASAGRSCSLLSVGATLAASLALSLYLAWRQRRRNARRRRGALVRGVRAAARAARRAAARDRRRRRSRTPRARKADCRTPPRRSRRSSRRYLRARYEPDADRAALAELAARVAQFRPARA